MIHHLTLQQIRLYESVVRLQSYTKAATEMHISQPAVSIQLKRLEESIGFQLIEQAGRKFRLTHVGEEVYQACADVLARLGLLGATISDLHGKVGGTLKISGVTTTKYFLPNFIGRFLSEYPEVQPEMHVTNKTRLIRQLERRQCEIAVLGRVLEMDNVISTPFMPNYLVAIAHPDHPLAGQKRIVLSAFAKEPMLSREVGSGTRRAREVLFAKHGIKTRPFMELDSNESIKQAVMAGLGVSIISSSSITHELKAGRLTTLKVEELPLKRQWYVAHLADQRLSITSRTFIDYLTEQGASAERS